jgi:E3 ubiquitin-protein ligase UBR7
VRLADFAVFRDDLIQYLRPFAAEGKEVSESDVQAFFDARREGRSG